MRELSRQEAPGPVIYPKEHLDQAWAQCPKCEPAGSVKRFRLTIYHDGRAECRQCGPVAP